MVLQNLAGEPSRNIVNLTDIWDLESWQQSSRKMQLLTAWEFWSEGTLIENTLPVTIPTDNLFYTTWIHWQKGWKVSAWVYIRPRWIWLNNSGSLRTPTVLDGDFQDLILPSEVPSHNPLYIWASGEGLSAVPTFCRVKTSGGWGRPSLWTLLKQPRLLCCCQTEAPLALRGALVLLQLQEASLLSSCLFGVSMKLFWEMLCGERLLAGSWSWGQWW